jgi:hypothetical protein
MGEYGNYLGTRIKIGTCENMSYLRPDQRHLVQAAALFDLTDIRFRFPFPDEDHLAPGDFDDPDRGLTVWGYQVPNGLDHFRVQFKAAGGVLVSLPCPFSDEAKASDITYHFNGFRGPARIVQQRAWAGVWATVMACGPCDAKYRLPDLDAAQPLLHAIQRQIATAEHDKTAASRRCGAPSPTASNTATRPPSPRRHERRAALALRRPGPSRQRCARVA